MRRVSTLMPLARVMLFIVNCVNWRTMLMACPRFPDVAHATRCATHIARSRWGKRMYRQSCVVTVHASLRSMGFNLQSCTKCLERRAPRCVVVVSLYSAVH